MKHQENCLNNFRNMPYEGQVVCFCSQPTCPLCSRTDSHKHSAETTRQPQPLEDALRDPIAMSEFPEKEGWEEEVRSGASWTQDGGAMLIKIRSLLAQTEKAFGGCKNCYGKGYATTKRQATGRNYFEELNPILPCKCSRGEQIKEILALAKEEERARIKKLAKNIPSATRWEIEEGDEKNNLSR